MSGDAIPYGRQSISEEDIAAVVEALRGDWLTQGPAVPAFELAVAKRCQAAHAVAVNSATSALHLACLALGVGAGDVVWTTPNTFVATANCARQCGADIDFVDIDPATWCISPKALSDKLARARRLGERLPKVVIPVHFAGQSCDMQAIAALGTQYGFGIIEDAAHAIGGSYAEGPVGNCAYSDITVFSFHPVKIITTAEGGMALTNRPELAERMALLRSHGITRDAARMAGKPVGPWSYEQLELGYNYRMSDIHAVLGTSQLGRLDEFVARRNQLAASYDDALADLPIQRQQVPGNVVSARHLYVIRVAAEHHSPMFDALRAAGIGVNLHYIPVHLQPYYRQLGFVAGQFPEAEAHYREALSLPLYPSLGDAQLRRVAQLVRTLCLAMNADRAS